MAAHANLSPSGAYRWLACPGSLALIRKLNLPYRSSVYAQEGTAAHTLAEKCLQVYSVGPHVRGSTITNDDGSRFVVDTDMIDAVKVYMEYAYSVAPLPEIKAGKITRALEKKVVVNDDVWGTCDFLAYNQKTKVLTVADYKHGRGVIVDPNTPQTKLYALGALKLLLKKGVEIDRVDIAIVQPRGQGAEAIRTYQTTPVELLRWEDDVLIPGIVATKQADAPLCAGDHCRFCDALAVCPQQAKNALAVAQVEFSETTVVSEATLPDPTDLSPDQIVKVMEMAAVLSAWAGKVAAFAQEQAEMGVPLPGYKLVPKRSLRQWFDVEVAATTLEMSLGDSAYTRKLVSPAGAEKALKALGFDKSALADLVRKPDNGTMLVPESDRRIAVVPAVLGEYMDTMDVLQ